MRTGFQYEERADTRFLTVNEAAIAHHQAFRKFGSLITCWIGYPRGGSPKNGAGSINISFAKKRFSASSVNVESLKSRAPVIILGLISWFSVMREGEMLIV
jgi:hypothetical protein